MVSQRFLWLLQPKMNESRQDREKKEKQKKKKLKVALFWLPAIDYALQLHVS